MAQRDHGGSILHDQPVFFTDVISREFERSGAGQAGRATNEQRAGPRHAPGLPRTLLAWVSRDCLESKLHGIHLDSLEKKIGTASTFGELVFRVFGAIAHFEHRRISECTRDGMASARKRDRHLGRPRLKKAAGPAVAQHLR
ncbi:MAG: recombinase family protein, partial [Gammaproteobacteria bacterium]|nr:recombinase family protein [Gammaproteobacteria bacterium]